MTLRHLHVPCIVLFGLACGPAMVPTGPTLPHSGDEREPSAEGEPPLGQLPDSVTPQHYTLALTIVPSEDRFRGTAQIRVAIEEPRSTIWLHGKDLAVSTATVTPVGGDPIEGTWEPVDDEGVVALRLPRSVPAGEATIAVDYDAPFDRTLKGLYRVDTGGDSYAFTQFEAISARQAFPSFDEPRFKTPFDVTLTVRKEHVAAANTLVIDEQEIADGMKRVRYATTERLPTYLLAWAVGPLDVVEAQPIPANDVRSRTIPFRGLAVRGQGARLAYALRETPAQVAWLEEYFAIEYPYDKLDIVAVPDFGSGAMENAGLITFREWLLLVDEATAAEDQKRAFAYVMAHELAHQWFGNLVTMPWWDDIWLNEAFATWMGNKVIRHLNESYKAEESQLSRVHGAMRADSLSTARQIRQPIENNHDIRNAFDAITYSKGGGVLEMFERWMGAETFRAGMRLHVQRHRFGVAAADDLLASLTEASGRDVATPFRTFLLQPGVPFLEVELDCQGQPRLKVRQSRYLPVGSPGAREASWQLPLCARYESGGEIRQSCALIAEQEGELPLEGEQCPQWVMPNADGAGYFRFSLPGEQMERLATRAWRQLTPRERMAYADSLSAAYYAGSIPASDVFPAMARLASDEVRSVAGTPMGLIEHVHERVADDELRPRVEGYARRLYGPVFRRLGWGPRRGSDDDGERALLRERVVEFLAFTANDPRVRREAASRGKRYLGIGTNGAIDADAVEPNLVDVALAVAVQEGDSALFDTMVQRLHASDDATLRGRILGALGHARDPELATRARALSLDERLRANEITSPLGAQMSMRETREATWRWLQDEFDPLVARIGHGRAGWLPWFTASFCSAEDAQSVRSFFAPRIEDLGGGPRNLAGALEAVSLCSAVVEAQGQGARTLFANERP